MTPLLCFLILFFNNKLLSSFNDFFCLNRHSSIQHNRWSSNVHKFQARTNYQKHSVKYNRLSICNKLTKSIKGIKRSTFDLFRKKLKLIFSSNKKIIWMISFSYFSNYYNPRNHGHIHFIILKISLSRALLPKKVCWELLPRCNYSMIVVQEVCERANK